MTHDEMIAVIQAHKEGKQIQFRKSNGEWLDVDELICNLSDYRIKPEPHYRPFKSAEEVMAAIKEHGDWICWGKILYQITSIFFDNHITYGSEGKHSFEYLFDEHYTFADGTPFGKLGE